MYNVEGEGGHIIDELRPSLPVIVLVPFVDNIPNGYVSCCKTHGSNVPK